MKRLFAQIGLTYLSVLAVVFYLGKSVAFVLMLLFALLIVVFFAVKKYRQTTYLPVMACVALVACVVNILYTTFVFDKTVEQYSDFKGEVVAKLEDEPYCSYDLYHYEFKCVEADSKKANFKFVLYSQDLYDIKPLSTIKTNVELSKTDNKSSIAKRYFLSASFVDEKPVIKTVKEPQKGFKYFALKIRENIRETLYENLNDEAFALTSAVLIGDKYALTDLTRQQFVQAGVSHLIVVSGMHFSIFVSLFFVLARLFKRYRIYFYPAAILFIFLYMGVTGFPPSVVRSGIMLLIFTFGSIFFLEPYPPNSLGAAAVVLTIFNPYIAGDIGLILSFATTFSIVTLAPLLTEKCLKRIKNHKLEPKNKNAVKTKLRRVKDKIIYVLVAMLCVNISAYVASLPLSILLFKATPTLSIIASMLLYLPMQILLVTSFLIGLLGFFPFLSFVLAPLSVLAQLLTSVVLAIVDFLAKLPFSYIHVTHNFVYLWLLLSAILCIWMFSSKEKHRFRVVALSVILIFLIGQISAMLLDSKVSSINVYNVDNGVAVMYTSPDTTAVLSLDCNSKNAYKTISKFENQVTHIDFASSVANTQNSANSLKSLTKAFAIENVLLYDNKRTVSLPKMVENTIVPSNFQKLALSATETLTFYKIGEKYITFLQTETCTMLILPKGIDVADIPEEFRSASVIVFSKYPQNFELLSCDTLIISETQDYAYYDMKLTYPISKRVLLSAEGDIKIVMEV